MRDLLITAIVFGSLPVILRYPFIGLLMWSWIGYMNPHRLTMGFAFDYPFAQIIAIATLLGLVFAREPKRIPLTSITVVWLLLVLWMNVTTYFALVPDAAMPEWERAMKIQLFSFLTLMLVTTPQRLNWLIWVVVASLGFYGLKGGLFSLLTGGEYLVFGPLWSFIQDNNALALALIMTLPLMRYLQIESPSRLVRHGIPVVMILTGVAILASQSRGAVIAGTAMASFLLLKSPHRIRLALGMLIVIPFLLAFMPEAWFDRMATIASYEEDPSAMGRINAWWFAYNVALERPILGGGYNVFTPELFRLYAPDSEDFHDSHSIYFEMLGEHGFFGLGLFLLLGLLALRTAGWIIRQTRRDPALRWAYTLAGMLQVSIIGYAVGGLFLGLAYFDLYYHLVAMVVLLRRFVEGALQVTHTAAAYAGVPMPDGTLNAPSGRAT